jgi:hypothetical protein
MALVRGVGLVASLGGAIASFGACGDAEPPPSEVPVDRCEPYLAPNWAPQWTPPNPTSKGACTLEQIDLEYTICEEGSAVSDACTQFRRDPKNLDCEACLFSDTRDPSYGPIILAGVVWKTNTPGCIAVLDEDNAGKGCGAKVQAASACYDAACEACQPFDAFIKCRQRAISTICRAYYLDSVCLTRPKYAICTEYVTSRDYFRAAAKFFCSSAVTAIDKEDGRAR